jgi:hypothetical protein
MTDEPEKPENPEEFWNVVGSETFDNPREEFISGLDKCGKNKYTFDPETGFIEFEQACSTLFMHFPGLYTEVFCKQCGICVEVKGYEANFEQEASGEKDEMDEFLSIVGTDPEVNDDWNTYKVISDDKGSDDEPWG